MSSSNLRRRCSSSAMWLTRNNWKVRHGKSIHRLGREHALSKQRPEDSQVRTDEAERQHRSLGRSCDLLAPMDSLDCYVSFWQSNSHKNEGKTGLPKKSFYFSYLAAHNVIKCLLCIRRQCCYSNYSVWGQAEELWQEVSENWTIQSQWQAFVACLSLKHFRVLVQGSGSHANQMLLARYFLPPHTRWFLK